MFSAQFVRAKEDFFSLTCRFIDQPARWEVRPIIPTESKFEQPRES